MHIRRNGMVAVEPLTREDDPQNSDASQATVFDPQVFVDTMAEPFWDITERLERARAQGADEETWFALLDTTVFVWRFAANYFPTQFDKDTSAETVELLKRISAFMDKACAELRITRQDALIQRVIELNVNMCHQVLTMTYEGEQIAPKSAAA